MEKVDLATKRPIACAVLGDEFLEDDVGLPLVKSLLYKHPDHPVLKILQHLFRVPGRHAGNRHEECRAGNIVPVRTPCLAIGITQLLLAFALLAIANLF